MMFKKARTLILLFLLLNVFSCRQRSPSPVPGVPVPLEREIEYFFTIPTDTLRNQRVLEEIIGVIKNAQKELYIFCYELNNEEIVKAIYEKFQEGVRIKILGSSDQKYDQLDIYRIPYEIYHSSGLQHIKMILADRNILFAGTGNFTTSDLFYNSNFFFKVRIPEETGNLIIKKFYELSYESPVVIHGSHFRIRILKSPENGDAIQSILNNAILYANSDIYFFIFSFFDPAIMNSMVFKSRQGKRIYGIIDDNSLRNNGHLKSFLSAQQGNNIFLYRDLWHLQYIDHYGIKRGAKNHHKTLIVDNIIYTGSYNYSLSAKDSNMEVFFAIEDPLHFEEIFDEYRQLFVYSTLIKPEKENLNQTTNDITIQDTVCQRTPGNSFYFQNKNAFLFYLHFTSNVCPPKYSPYTGGIISSSTDGFLFLEGAAIKNFLEIRWLKKESFLGCSSNCDFCEIYSCSPVSLTYWDTGKNAFVLPDGIETFEKVFFWDGKKLYELRISRILHFDKTYYLYDAYDLQGTKQNISLQEGIVFFLDKKQLYISCLKQNTLRKNLKTFLTLLEWYDEKFLPLPDRCYEIKE